MCLLDYDEKWFHFFCYYVFSLLSLSLSLLGCAFCWCVSDDDNADMTLTTTTTTTSAMRSSYILLVLLLLLKSTSWSEIRTADGTIHRMMKRFVFFLPKKFFYLELCVCVCVWPWMCMVYEESRWKYQTNDIIWWYFPFIPAYRLWASPLYCLRALYVDSSFSQL